MRLRGPQRALSPVNDNGDDNGPRFDDSYSFSALVARKNRVWLRQTDPTADPVEDWLQTATGVARGRTTTRRVLKPARGED